METKFDLWQKIRFAAVFLPVIGVVGALMRAIGFSEAETLATVVPALVVAFVGVFMWLPHERELKRR